MFIGSAAKSYVPAVTFHVMSYTESPGVSSPPSGLSTVTAGGVAAGACTLSLTLPSESVPVPDALYAKTVMFAHSHGLTLTFMNVAAVPFVHAPFSVTL